MPAPMISTNKETAIENHPAPRSQGCPARRTAFAKFISSPPFFFHSGCELTLDRATLIEATGVALNSLKRTRVTPGSSVVVIRAARWAKCEIDFDPLVTNDICAIGGLGSPNCWDEAISLHRRGLISVQQLITYRIPLRDFVDGIERTRNRRGEAIKVLIAM